MEFAEARFERVIKCSSLGLRGSAFREHTFRLRESWSFSFLIVSPVLGFGVFERTLLRISHGAF